MIPRMSHRVGLALGLVLAATFVLVTVVAPAESSPLPTNNTYYVVRPGDSWSSIAWRYGLSVAELKAANPQAIRPRDRLWIGDRLFIPASAPSAGGGYWYAVKRGDTWYTVSSAVGVPVLDLWHANPGQVRTNRWIYAGEKLWIPQWATDQSWATDHSWAPEPIATVSAAPPATPTALPPPVEWKSSSCMPLATAESVTGWTQPTNGSQPISTPEITVGASPTITEPVSVATPAAPEMTPTSTAVLTPTAVPTIMASPTVTESRDVSAAAPTPAATPKPGCPDGLNSYGDEIAARLNSPGDTLDGLASWLGGCGAIQDEQGIVVHASLQTTTTLDIVVVIRDPAADQPMPRGLLLVYHTGPKGYTLARTAESTGAIQLLRTGDINADDKSEVVWTDTTCGAHTCFSTLRVEQWDGKAYVNWIVGEPTMAYAEYSFEDVIAGGSGEEIIAYGGLVGSAGAGPQRAWTETYVSPEGGPYQLYSLVYDESPCLYHRILDANQAFAEWMQSGFQPAIQAYQSAIDDTDLQVCWTLPDELATLRDFARFRQVVAYVASGQSSQVAALKAQISSPGLLGAANAFLDSYVASGSVIQACRDANTYAEGHPDAWQFLADWGYANPTFSAQSLCPLGQ